jgi:hypothetical protein
MVRRGFALAALAAALLAPSASASSASQVQLAVIPLPKSALGPAGRSLPLAHDSGVVSNTEAANEANGHVTGAQLKALGRVTGYLLDYGNPFGSLVGVREIQTAVERYRTAADARKGLEFWRRDELKSSALKKVGIDFTVKKLRPAGVPGPHWVYAGTVSIKGLKPIHGVDAAFQQGQYVLGVSVSAGTISAAAHLVPTVARRLNERVRLALAGRLHAGPVKLPPALKAGPPPQGPKPAGLVLTTGDVGGSASVAHAGYSKPKDALDENALSVYDQTLTSHGSFPFLSQEVLVGSNKLEVRYFSAIAVSALAAGFGHKAHTTPVTLAGVGDNARGELVQVTINGRTAYEAVVVLTHGSYLDFLVGASATPFTAADVLKLAHLAQKQLDAGF